MRRLLWVGDAGCDSGFAKSTHALCNYLDYHANPGGQWDVTVLGVNYRGDPHHYAYPLYVAMAEGDVFGVERLIWMCDHVKPDLIVIQQDPWNFPAYLEKLRKFHEYDHVPVVGIVAVDGLNCLGSSLNGLAYAIFWTEFGKEQAQFGGYAGESSVIPLGVDLSIYSPGSRLDARRALQFPAHVLDAFIFGNVNRNQPRKRMDLTIRYFSLFWRSVNRPRDVYLYLHVAPSGEFGYNLKQLAQYYGVTSQLILAQPAVWYGLEEELMVQTYRAFDAQISTTQGEGDGLTTKEGMACGIPQAVPDWSALGEWARDAALLIPCTSTAATVGRANAIGGIADEDRFVAALRRLYSDSEVRARHAARGLELMRQDRYRWTTIGQQVAEVLDGVHHHTMETVTARAS